MIHHIKKTSKILLRRISRLGDRKTIETYLKNHEIRKLQIGCGNNPFNEWLNTEYEQTLLGKTIFLDATKKFPFADNTFNYIFCEHMIEHIPYNSGAAMVAECFRVLTPKGRLRISTPDLKFLFDLYSTPKTAIQNEFIQYQYKQWPNLIARPSDTHIINSHMRAWGHQFIYDEVSLTQHLVDSGFSNVKRMEIESSDDPVLQNLEHAARKPPGLIELESLILEGEKQEYI